MKKTSFVRFKNNNCSTTDRQLDQL